MSTFHRQLTSATNSRTQAARDGTTSRGSAYGTDKYALDVPAAMRCLTCGREAKQNPFSICQACGNVITGDNGFAEAVFPPGEGHAQGRGNLAQLLRIRMTLKAVDNRFSPCGRDARPRGGTFLAVHVQKYNSGVHDGGSRSHPSASS